MESNKIAFYAIIFNLIMAILLFTTSELILIEISGYQVNSVDISIQYSYVLTPSGTPIPMPAPLSIPNYPLMIFILTLLGNAIFIVLLRRKKSIITPK